MHSSAETVPAEIGTSPADIKKYCTDLRRWGRQQKEWRLRSRANIIAANLENGVPRSLIKQRLVELARMKIRAVQLSGLEPN